MGKMFRQTWWAAVVACGIVVLVCLTAIADGGERVTFTLLRSERGDESQIRLLQFDGGRDAKYIVALRRRVRSSSPTAERAVTEWLWPTSRLMPTEIVYDCTEEALHGKAKPILCDLSRTAVRVFAILPTQVEQIELRCSPTVIAGRAFEARVEFQDAGGKRLRGMLPFHVELVRPDGEPLHDSFVMTQTDGTAALSLPLPADAPLGKWRFEVRSQLNGLTESLPVIVTGEPGVE